MAQKELKKEGSIHDLANLNGNLFSHLESMTQNYEYHLVEVFSSLNQLHQEINNDTEKTSKSAMKQAFKKSFENLNRMDQIIQNTKGSLLKQSDLYQAVSTVSNSYKEYKLKPEVEMPKKPAMNEKKAHPFSRPLGTLGTLAPPLSFPSYPESTEPKKDKESLKNIKVHPFSKIKQTGSVNPPANTKPSESVTGNTLAFKIEKDSLDALASSSVHTWDSSSRGRESDSQKLIKKVSWSEPLEHEDMHQDPILSTPTLENETSLLGSNQEPLNRLSKEVSSTPERTFAQIKMIDKSTSIKDMAFDNQWSAVEMQKLNSELCEAKLKIIELEYSMRAKKYLSSKDTELKKENDELIEKCSNLENTMHAAAVQVMELEKTTASLRAAEDKIKQLEAKLATQKDESFAVSFIKSSSTDEIQEQLNQALNRNQELILQLSDAKALLMKHQGSLSDLEQKYDLLKRDQSSKVETDRIHLLEGELKQAQSLLSSHFALEKKQAENEFIISDLRQQLQISQEKVKKLVEVEQKCASLEFKLQEKDRLDFENQNQVKPAEFIRIQLLEDELKESERVSFGLRQIVANLQETFKAKEIQFQKELTSKKEAVEQLQLELISVKESSPAMVKDLEEQVEKLKNALEYYAKDSEMLTDYEAANGPVPTTMEEMPTELEISDPIVKESLFKRLKKLERENFMLEREVRRFGDDPKLSMRSTGKGEGRIRKSFLKMMRKS